MILEWKILPIHLLKPAAYNPRKPLVKGSAGYRKLERSLTEFGLVQPIVWNERTGNVVGGHQRLQILIDQGITELPCIVVSLSAAKEKALNVALNNSQIGSTWDDAKLLPLLNELQQLPEIDETLTGFDTRELQDLLFVPAAELPPLPEPEPDAHLVRVALTIQPTHWETVRPQLDELLAPHAITLHVQLPQFK